MNSKELRETAYEKSTIHKISQIKRLLRKKHFKNKEENYKTDRALYKDMRRTFRKEETGQFLVRSVQKTKAFSLEYVFGLDGMKRRRISTNFENNNEMKENKNECSFYPDFDEVVVEKDRIIAVD